LSLDSVQRCLHIKTNGLDAYGMVSSNQLVQVHTEPFFFSLEATQKLSAPQTAIPNGQCNRPTHIRVESYISCGHVHGCCTGRSVLALPIPRCSCIGVITPALRRPGSGNILCPSRSSSVLPVHRIVFRHLFAFSSDQLADEVTH